MELYAHRSIAWNRDVFCNSIISSVKLFRPLFGRRHVRSFTHTHIHIPQTRYVSIMLYYFSFALGSANIFKFQLFGVTTSIEHWRLLYCQYIWIGEGRVVENHNRRWTFSWQWREEAKHLFVPKICRLCVGCYPN